MRFLRMAFAASGAAVCVWGGVANAASTVTLVPHRAVYDLTLDRADEKSGISGLTGRMVYEFNGSACDGYTTNFRFVTRIDMDEQPQRVTDQQTTTFESGMARISVSSTKPLSIRSSSKKCAVTPRSKTEKRS